MKRTNLVALFVAFSFPSVAAQAALVIDTVPVGNPGNANDTRYIDGSHPSGVGAVAYSYNIGKTEVTNAQYVEFLNAVAATDTYGLYSASMGSDTRGGIVRSGAPGSYSYSVKPAALSGAYLYGDKPVVYVSSGDAMRFANWLQNGQPTGAQGAGTTEGGAYLLNGAIGSALFAVTRNAGATWWLPNESEWYKAAYYNPGTSSYFDYPTRTNSVPNNNLPSSDTGNSANFYNSNIGYTTGNSSFPLTDAGAYTLSDSPYGTFDQGGNVFEWNETLFGFFRGLRGGSWDGSSNYLRASDWDNEYLTDELIGTGFRVASIPEPSTVFVGALGIVVLLLRRRGRS